MTDKIACAGMLVIREDGNVLLVRTNKGYRWGMPFGKGEPGETPMETAIRETREETGILVTEARQLYSRQLDDGTQAVTYLALSYHGEATSSAEGYTAWRPMWFLCGEDGRFRDYNSDLMAVLLKDYLRLSNQEANRDPKE